MKNHAAKKSLGQNFLVDQNYQRKIIEATLSKNPEYLLEIGPGLGAITNHLLETHLPLILVEKDKDIASSWREKINPETVTLFEQDFLKFDYSNLPEKQKITVVSNLPYNVSSQILISLLTHHNHFNDLYLMFQKEVALRCVAKENTKDYGLLSLWSQIYSDPKLLFHLPPTVFKPQPKVTSSIVHFKMREEPLLKDLDQVKFWEFARKLFQQRRKTIRSIIKKDVSNPSLLEKDVFSQRIGELSVGEIIGLFEVLV